jgi:hypothetical protein
LARAGPYARHVTELSVIRISWKLGVRRLVLGALLVAVTGCAERWHTLVMDDGFRVDLPGHVVSSVTLQHDADFPENWRWHKAFSGVSAPTTKGVTSYMVGEGTLPGGDAERHVDGIIQFLKSETPQPLLRSEPVVLAGCPGVRLEFRDEAAATVANVVSCGSRLFLLTFTRAKERASMPDDAERFFSSFGRIAGQSPVR